MGKGQRLNIGADQADRWRRGNGRKRRRRWWRPQYLLALVMVPLAVIVSQHPDIIGAAPTLTRLSDGVDVTSPAVLPTGAGCRIKGNVSIDSGERIYHVPGQKYYSQTIIRREFGERWFCSEAEAHAAGWRRARK